MLLCVVCVGCLKCCNFLYMYCCVKRYYSLPPCTASTAHVLRELCSNFPEVLSAARIAKRSCSNCEAVSSAADREGLACRASRLFLFFARGLLQSLITISAKYLLQSLVSLLLSLLLLQPLLLSLPMPLCCYYQSSHCCDCCRCTAALVAFSSIKLV